MRWTHEAYRDNLGRFGRRDGIKALAAYGLIMGSCFFQGWLYTTDLSASLLNFSQLWISLFVLAVCLVYLVASKEGWGSIGITTGNAKGSILLGILGGVLLLGLQTVLTWPKGAALSLLHPALLSWLLFIVCAVEEELLFRGYIQTRLAGAIRIPWLASAVNALFFLSIHYPVRWVVSGTVSLGVLSGVYVVMLLLLHGVCDGVYKRTNCLWGSIVLHILYNAVGAMVVFQ